MDAAQGLIGAAGTVERRGFLVPLLLHDMRHALQQPDAVLGLAADLAGKFFKSAAQHGIVFVS